MFIKNEDNGFHKVKMSISAVSACALSIDGFPVKHITALKAETSVDAPTIVTVSFIADVNVENMALTVLEDTSNDIS